MKNRTIIGIVCMLLAIAVCFGVAPIINRGLSAKTDVVIMLADVPQGRQISEEDIKIEMVGAYGLSPKTITNTELVIGKFAATDLKTDEMLIDSKITDNAEGAEDVFRALDGSKQAISITIPNFAGGLSGKLKNGDIVSVIVTNENVTAIPAELKYVRVITTTSSGGNDAGEMDEDGNEMPSTITLLANDVQATILATSEANGKLHLSLVYRGNADTAAKFLQAQETVFAEVDDE